MFDQNNAATSPSAADLLQVIIWPNTAAMNAASTTALYGHMMYIAQMNPTYPALSSTTSTLTIVMNQWA